MSTVHHLPAQSMDWYPMPTEVTSAILTQKFSKLSLEEQEKQQSLQRLFSFLQELSVHDVLTQEAPRPLVEACKERGVEYLLTVKKLDLCFCELKEIPSEVGLLTQLEYLGLDNNQLTDLPLSLYSLAGNLWTLNLAGNKFTTLPQVVHDIAIKRMNDQEPFELYLRDNPMKEVPNSLRRVICTRPHGSTYWV